MDRSESGDDDDSEDYDSDDENSDDRSTEDSSQTSQQSGSNPRQETYTVQATAQRSKPSDESGEVTIDGSRVYNFHLAPPTNNQNNRKLMASSASNNPWHKSFQYVFATTMVIAVAMGIQSCYYYHYF